MSSVTIIPFKAWHLDGLGVSGLDAASAKIVEAADSVSVIGQDSFLLCGGITEYWPGRGHIWSLFSPACKHNFVPVFRAIKFWVNDRLKNKYHRIEMSVDYGLEVANRRAKMLGFELECERAKMYLPDRRDASIYSLVRK